MIGDHRTCCRLLQPSNLRVGGQGLATGQLGGALGPFEAPRNILHPPDYREKVTARSVDEAARTLRDNPDCAELDFAYNVELAGRRVYALHLVTATGTRVPRS